LFSDKRNKLWIGTKSNGLNKLIYSRHCNEHICKSAGEKNPVPTFLHYRYNSYDRYSLFNDEVFSIFEDKSGILWIGTNGGLSKFDQNKKRFVQYRPMPDQKYGLKGRHVRAFYQDSSGVFWIGTYEGLNRMSQDENGDDRFLHYNHSPNDPGSLSNDRIMSICQDRSGRFWLATQDGLNYFKASSDESEPITFSCFKHDNKKSNSLSSNMVRVVFTDKRDNLWIGTENGLNLLPLVSQV
jgi:ligand-binding sensor domain-containing protein